MAGTPRKNLEYSTPAARAIIRRGNEILLGIGITQLWVFPGGGIERESPTQCCKREIKKETGLTIEGLTEAFSIWTYQTPHRYEVFFEVEIAVGELHDNEHDCCERWRWFPLDNLPNNLSPITRRAIKAIQNGEKGLIEQHPD